MLVGQPFINDPTPAVKYQLCDHLGSSNLVIDSTGDLINREEYFPYGETSFGSFAKKRYRFTGKERDEESGLYYHGARYYAPWLVRWMSCDTVAVADDINLYRYTRANPLRLRDASGNAGTPPLTEQTISGADSGSNAALSGSSTVSPPIGIDPESRVAQELRALSAPPSAGLPG